MDTLDKIIDIGEALAVTITELKVRDEIPMTRQQAAVYLGVSDSTIDNYRKQGRIQIAVKHGITGYLPSDLRKIRK